MQAKISNIASGACWPSIYVARRITFLFHRNCVYCLRLRNRELKCHGPDLVNSKVRGLGASRLPLIYFQVFYLPRTILTMIGDWHFAMIHLGWPSLIMHHELLLHCKLTLIFHTLRTLEWHALICGSMTSHWKYGANLSDYDERFWFGCLKIEEYCLLYNTACLFNDPLTFVYTIYHTYSCLIWLWDAIIICNFDNILLNNEYNVLSTLSTIITIPLG